MGEEIGMNELDAITIVVSFIVTWSVGLFPPVLLRYAILKRPMKKWYAIGICALFYFINLFIFIFGGSQNKFHGALGLIALTSYFILRQGSASKTNNTGIAASARTES